MNGGAALILMGKAPFAGAVKTRLSPFVAPREAASFYACMLKDTAEEMSHLRGVRRYLFFAPRGSRGRFGDTAFDGYLLRPQSERDLGGRMADAIAQARGDGAVRVAVVGSDCPALSASRVRLAFRELSGGAGAVFGPARDGGFYLAGLSAHAPSLFRKIAWSTPGVFEEVLARCRAAGIAYALLPPEGDVDEGKDLDDLRHWLRRHPDPPCPRTRRWISEREGAIISPSVRTAARPLGKRASGPPRGR